MVGYSLNVARNWPTSGCAAARTTGIGPQFGYLFPAGDMQGYFNFKAYWDYDTENCAHRYTAWVTLAFSPKPPATEASRPIAIKAPPHN
jgi:hypothetical protein